MNYIQAREFLKDTGKYGSVLGLDSIKRLLDRLGNPQKELKAVHIAGTNGKGSVMAFLENILIRAGLNVGRYSSPAVFSEREIIKYNHDEISENDFASIISDIKEACEELTKSGYPHPTSFEIETALAYVFFQKKKCDIVLVECGMGGQTDATNVFDEVLLSIIATISLDHMKFLGDTIAQITKVKAGIIKQGCPVVATRQTKEAIDVLKNVAHEKNAPLIVTGKTDDIKTEGYITKFNYYSSDGKAYPVCLNALGTYQILNSTTAIEAAIALQSKGYNLQDYILPAIRDTIWNGRLEVISKEPLIVIDGAHNPGAVEELKKSIDLYFTNRRITFIMGVLADKDFQSEVKLLAQRANHIITVTPDNARALDAGSLASVIKEYNNNVEIADSFSEAVDMALKTIDLGESDMILAFGSLSYLGAIKDVFKQKCK